VVDYDYDYDYLIQLNVYCICTSRKEIDPEKAIHKEIDEDYIENILRQ
jgi:hypothetical protein